MVNIGVLGSGWVVGWHVFGVRHNEDVCVKALMSRNEATGKEAAKQFGANYYRTYQEMYEKEELDGVINLLPNHLHYESCCDAIDAGIRHILCEKPLGNDLALTEKLVEKAEATGAMLQTGYMKRFNPAFQKAKEALGVIGSVQFASFFTAETGAENQVSHRDTSSSWKTDPALSGGGNLTHVGSHDIDFIRYLFGDVKAVSCRLRRDAEGQPEYYANGRLYMENGLDVELKIGRVDVPDLGPDWEVFKGGWNEILEIIGDRGYIRVANPSWEGLSAAKVTSWFRGQPGPSVEYCQSSLQWVNEIADFASAIKAGKLSRLATSARDGYKVDLAVRCMRKSDELGGAVVPVGKSSLL
ncbi:MAG: Gfo/Idh/MocA family oxidoreductase [Clostridiales bacterium]|nr:Gfo/Idh/MocA family oxidoreductase [Clostridiales bacterium]